MNELIRDYVKQYILDHQLSAGDPLPSESQLAQDLGVGRSSVREAIKALQSLGIVDVRHGNGLYVRPYTFDPIIETLNFGMNFDAQTLAELAEIRVLLERAAVEEVVSRIHTEQIDQLEDILSEWRKRTKSQDDARDLDEEYHRILYASLNNRTLMNLFEVFWIAFENLDDPVIHDARPIEYDYNNHRALLDAVKLGQADLARQIMVEHFGNLQDRIRRARSQSSS